MLRCKTVIDRDYDAITPVTQATAQWIVSVEIADDEAAAVQVDEYAQGFACFRLAGPIDARGNFASRSGNGALLGAVDRFFVRIHQVDHDLIAGPCLGQGLLPIGWPSGLFDQIKNFLNISIDWHCSLSQLRLK